MLGSRRCQGRHHRGTLEFMSTVIDRVVGRVFRRQPATPIEHPPTWLARVAVTGAMERFDVVFYRDEAGWYIGEAPELPGCVSQGSTLDEFMANITEAAELVVESRLAAGLLEREDLTRPTPVFA